MLKIIEKTKVWFTISLILILIGLGVFCFKGLNYGIDFKGGTIINIDMKGPFDKDKVNNILDKYAKDKYVIKVANEGKELDIIVQAEVLNEEKSNELVDEIKEQFKLDDSSILEKENLGASIGKELKSKAFLALIVANIAMLIYIGIRFEFNFALAAILAVLHDVLITISVYAIFRIPVNTPFIAAILTIVGYSINDTIVIFDRIRENSKKMRKAPIEEVADVSITQTMSRSINTALTTLFTITAVYFFVPSIREFSFPLIIGIAAGAYSSIFIASPIWVLLKKRKTQAKAAK